MNAIGATELVRTICASAGIAGVVATQGVSPEVDPEEWHHARYLLDLGLEPDVDRAPSVAQAPRRAPQRCPALRRRPVPKPHRPGRRRAPAPAPGHRRGAGIGDDASGGRRRARRRGMVSRSHRRLRRAARAPRRASGRALGGDLRGRPPSRSPRSALDFARTQPALLRLGVGAQRHLGAPVAYRTIACLPALVGAWRHRGGGCSYIPTATASAIPSAVLDGAELRSGEVRPDQHVAARRGAHRPGARAAGEGAGGLVVEPRPDRARAGAGAGGAAARGPVHARDRAVHDRHRHATPT